MSSSSGLEVLSEWIPTGITFITVLFILILTHKAFERFFSKSGVQFRNQTILLGLSLVGFLAVVFSLPIPDAARGQILTFLGVLLSAALALSSTTILGNLLAGLMLRAVKNFRPGDFIQVGDSFGRVTELGFFHVEIQTQYRDLTTLPNLHLVQQPVNVIRSSGTFVSANVSLGYDVPHRLVNHTLKAAAEASSLEETHVRVMELGDFSVTYQVSGLLTQVKNLLSVRSQLKENMLDHLHAAGIEIVSPTYMNQRQFSADRKTIPEGPRLPEEKEPDSSLDAIVFDKAEEAESIELLRKRVEDLESEEGQLKKRLSEAKDQEKEKISQTIKSKAHLREILSDRIQKLSEQQEQKD